MLPAVKANIDVVDYRCSFVHPPSRRRETAFARRLRASLTMSRNFKNLEKITIRTVGSLLRKNLGDLFGKSSEETGMEM